MIKTAVVEIPKTPSIVSGKPSEMIKNGEAVCLDEPAPKVTETDLADKVVPVEEKEVPRG